MIENDQKFSRKISEELQSSATSSLNLRRECYNKYHELFAWSRQGNLLSRAAKLPILIPGAIFLSIAASSAGLSVTEAKLLANISRRFGL